MTGWLLCLYAASEDKKPGRTAVPRRNFVSSLDYLELVYNEYYL
jgi:hypothetical protein